MDDAPAHVQHYIFNRFSLKFTFGDVPMGEVVAGEQQMEREPHEVLHDFFYILFFT